MLVENTSHLHTYTKPSEPASDNDWGRSITYNRKGAAQE